MKEGRTETTEHRLWRRVRELEKALRECEKFLVDEVGLEPGDDLLDQVRAALKENGE